VLFDSLLRHMGDADVVDKATVWDTLFHFVIVTSGSIFVGVLCGAACSLYFYALCGKHTAVSEVALFFAWALVPYYIADGIGVSGIISIMVMGFMMDFYIIGGNQSEDEEWSEYTQMPISGGLAPVQDDFLHASLHPIESALGRLKEASLKALSGRGLILEKSRRHVGFVTEVISSLMETAIFAYLGLFLFNDRIWDVVLTLVGIFACVSSRAVMVILFSLLINACVLVDLESLLARLWKCIWQRPANARDDEDSDLGETRAYIDKKTQLILFAAGVRGAVSYALVQNIPVYDAVTEHGSHYKGELRSMTSAAIVIILFTFGALTYFTVRRDIIGARSNDLACSDESLTYRRRSTALISEPGFLMDQESDVDTSLNSPFLDRRASFEIERRSHPVHRDTASSLGTG
jgi:NhaP-type Na+/H+ or K+/H+ antiporter